MEKALFIRYELCTQCHSCEVACSVEHSRSRDLIAAVSEEPAPRSRIFFAPVRKVPYPVICRHCETAACISACPTGALYREQQGPVLFAAEKCTACFACLDACPVKVIRSTEEKTGILKCDLCPRRLAEDREPACVEACPTKAIGYKPKTELRYAIDPEVCRACGKCKRLCPEGAVRGEKKVPHEILQDKCVQCGICFVSCPFGSITQQVTTG